MLLSSVSAVTVVLQQSQHRVRLVREVVHDLHKILDIHALPQHLSAGQKRPDGLLTPIERVEPDGLVAELHLHEIDVVLDIVRRDDSLELHRLDGDDHIAVLVVHGDEGAVVKDVEEDLACECLIDNADLLRVLGILTNSADAPSLGILGHKADGTTRLFGLDEFELRVNTDALWLRYGSFI